MQTSNTTTPQQQQLATSRPTEDQADNQTQEKTQTQENQPCVCCPHHGENPGIPLQASDIFDEFKKQLFELRERLLNCNPTETRETREQTLTTFLNYHDSFKKYKNNCGIVDSESDNDSDNDSDTEGYYLPFGIVKPIVERQRTAAVGSAP